MKALWLLLGVCALSGLAGAQTPQTPFVYRGNGYGFTNVGVCIHGYGFVGGGGGGEVLVYKGLSVGGEGSYNTFNDGWQIGTLTGQVGYHFGDRKKRFGMDPFFTGGIGGAFSRRNGRMGASGNAGGGGTYWFKERVGLRFEGRALYVNRGELIVVGRIGVSFR